MSQAAATLGDGHLIPPVEMLFDGSSTAEQFVALSEGFVQHILVPRARLTSADVFLDLGCGNGAVARALTSRLALPGRYEGLDVNAKGIAWLQDNYAAYPSFRFTHADVFNKVYNAGGVDDASGYRLPYPNGTFSISLLKSVFTHMLPEDVRHYLKELGRVMAPGGRTVTTYFLLNDESRALVRRGLDVIKMPHDWKGDPLCRVANPDAPELATGHDEARIRAYVAEAGFTVAEIVYGDWCGRPTLLGLQDLMILIKS